MVTFRVDKKEFASDSGVIKYDGTWKPRILRKSNVKLLKSNKVTGCP
jgi:hypothetical protein